MKTTTIVFESHCMIHTHAYAQLQENQCHHIEMNGTAATTAIIVAETETKRCNERKIKENVLNENQILFSISTTNNVLHIIIICIHVV